MASLNAKALERFNRRLSSAGSPDRSMVLGSPNTSFGREPSSHGSEGAGSLGLSVGQSVSPRQRARSVTSEPNSSGGEAVKVICRVRPFAKRELEIQDEMNAKVIHDWDRVPLRSVVDMVDGKTTNFLDHEKGYAVRQSFAFDHSLWSVDPAQQESPNHTVTQDDVFGIVGVPAVNNVWQGYNTCVFAYGQTGSGKTYTMMGSDEQPGLIPRICRALFDELQRRQLEAETSKEPGVVTEYRLEARFLEIYNEKVKDLLWNLRSPEAAETVVDRENLKIRLVPGSGPQVVGLTTLQVRSLADCIALIEEGTNNRSVAATKMNEQSSRSHSIFRLTLTQTTTVLPQKQFEKPKHYHRVSTVSLVDLAGSERNKKTGAEGDRLKEAVAINKSLTTLKNVIDALVEQRPVVPYRDSTLTWLLSDNLGGNSKTFMIACVSPHLDNAEESLNTLRYAIRTQSVVTHATVNESDELRRMARMKEEMQTLKAQMLDTGEDALRSRMDELAASVAVKKEEHRKQLQLVDILNEALANAKVMQKNAAYANRCSLNITERSEAALRAESSRLKQDIAVLQFELERRVKDAARARDERKHAEAEEKASRERRAGLAADCKQHAQRAAGLEERKSALLIEDQDNGETIERKGPRVAAARNFANVLVAYQMHKSSVEIDAQAVAHNHERERAKAAVDRDVVKAQDEAEARVQALHQQQDQLRESIKAAKQQQADRTKELAERARRLHSRCIFYDNENKRCVTHADAQVVAASKKEISKTQAEEEEWRAKVAAVHTRQRQEYDRDREHARSAAHEQAAEHAARVARVQDTAERAMAKKRAETDSRVALMQADMEHRLLLLTKLNCDSETFVKEAKVAEPRYEALFASLSATVARRERERVYPADYDEAVTRMKAVVVAKRRTATPLAYRADGDGDGYGVVTPRSRSAGALSEQAAHSEAPTTPRRMGRSPSATPRSRSIQPRQQTTPSTGRSPVTGGASPPAGGGTSQQQQRVSRSPSISILGSTIDFLHTGQKPPASSVPPIKALKPAKVVAQPTRTSLLRCGMLNYKRKQPAAGPTGGSVSRTLPSGSPSASALHGGASGPATPRSVSRPLHPSADVSMTPRRGMSRSPARATTGGPPSHMAARSEARLVRLDPDAPPMLPLSPGGEHAAARAVALADGDGARRKVIYSDKGIALLSRSKSPAHAHPIHHADPTGTDAATTRTGNMTPRRAAAWR